MFDILVVYCFEKFFWRNMRDTFEETAEAADRREVERLAGLSERVMVYEHERLGFLNHRIQVDAFFLL